MRSAPIAASAASSIDNPDRAVSELLREWKQDQKTLLERFDLNHDGVLESDEWDRARAAARQQVVDNMAAATANAGFERLSKPADGRAFLLVGLGWRSARETLAPQGASPESPHAWARAPP